VIGYASLALPVLYLSYYLRDNTPAWTYLVYAFVPLLVFVPTVRRQTARMLKGDGR
jgi:hypothetical protein